MVDRLDEKLTEVYREVTEADVPSGPYLYFCICGESGADDSEDSDDDDDSDDSDGDDDEAATPRCRLRWR